MAADWIAAGLDPGAQHAVHPVAGARARRAVSAAVDDDRRFRGSSGCRPTKSRSSSSRRRTCRRSGFLGYPLLQTADIIIYNARYVPVGEDQVAHLELSREIVRRFHNFYGELFVEPEALLTTSSGCPASTTARCPRATATRSTFRTTRRPFARRSCRCTLTRSESGPMCRGRSKATPSSRTIDAFNPDTAEVEDLKTRYRAGKVGDVEVKTKLAKALERPPRADPRAARRGPGQAGGASGDPARGVAQGPCHRAGDDGARARRREADYR